MANSQSSRPIQKSENSTPTVAQVEQARECLSLIATGQKSTLTWEECFDILENTPDGALNTISGEYLNLECNKTYNMAFDGFETVDMPDRRNPVGPKRPVECVVLRDKQNNRFLCGAAVLVTKCKQLTSQPCWIRIVVGENMVKSGQGEYFDITVMTF